MVSPFVKGEHQLQRSEVGQWDENVGLVLASLKQPPTGTDTETERWLELAAHQLRADSSGQRTAVSGQPWSTAASI